MNKIWLYINFIRSFVLYIMISVSGNQELIFEEIDYWYRINHWNDKTTVSKLIKLNWLICYEKAYRNLLCYRLKKFEDNKLVGTSVSSVICKIIIPGEKTLIIATDEIGKNLYIQHGFSCCITAKKIGENCWINQQVTIGYTFALNPPIIGNGVRISAGAKILGDITLEDNVIVAANAAVTKDVGCSLIVGGVPAKEIGINNDHRLYTKREV